MATQIAATPLLTGEEALRVIEESKTQLTERGRKYLEKLEKEFAGMMREHRD